MTPYHTSPTCRTCASRNLRIGLDLGLLPLANSFITSIRAKDPTPEPRYPLRLFFCENCGLIQLLDVVDKEEMFDDYAFLTATAKTSLDHFSEYAETLTRRLSLGDRELVVDIGSNDGTLLKAFKQHGAKVVGVEPARNLAAQAIAEGIPTLTQYLSEETVKQLGKNSARIVTANNVVSHVNDLDSFVNLVSELLAPNGLFTFEVPWVVDVLSHYNFDIIYHEHLSYFGFKPLSRVLEKHGLELIDLQHFPQIHGGTLRGLAAHSNEFKKNKDALERSFEMERRNAQYESLEAFASHVHQIKKKLTEILTDLKRDGNKIVGYGAPAKATILLNYCNIDRSIIEFIIDTTPLKQGKFVPGVRIPIVDPEEFYRAKPDYALLLAWNYKEEILRKEEAYRKMGGKFILPFPDPEIIG